MLEELGKAIDALATKAQNLITLVTNATADELDKLRSKFGVSKSGKHYNTSVDAIYSKIASAGFDDGAWNPPGSQGSRFEALKGKSSWKDGFLMTDEGDLKYPFISAGGKPMVSGIRACISRANSAGDSTAGKTASAVLEKINARNDK